MIGSKASFMRGTAAQITVVLAAASTCVFAQRLVDVSTVIANTVALSANTAAGKPSVTRVLSNDQVDRLRAISDRMDVIADNLANAETIAFKRRFTGSEDAPQNLHGNIRFDMSQGALEATGVNTDVAIEGNGFFKIKLQPNVGDGTGYTRSGSLFTNKNGDLVVGVGDGYQLVPPINIPAGATNIEIAQDGTVKFTPRGGNVITTAGQIQLSQFANEQCLTTNGESIFIETAASGPAIISDPGRNGAGELQQGYLEASNVDSAKELVRLSKARQWFAVCSQSMESADQAKLIIASIRN